MPIKKHLIIFYGLFILLITLFCFLRLRPIYLQTVGYTYDQGRDFLKTAEVFLYKNPTFIGPTTGIMGIYHGAWWYYLLGIPFILLKGSPIGFYYFNFLIHLLIFIISFIFIKKVFGQLPALFGGILMVISPYFIFTSLFVGNNIMVLPVLALFVSINFLILENKVNKKNLPIIFFVNGLLLGLVMEFEFAFGLFLIPAYLILALIFKQLRLALSKIKISLGFTLGLIISLSLRILFELKHGFMQTKTLLGFFLKPKLYNPKPYFDVVKDRYQLFIGYYKSLFPNDILALFVSLSLIVLLVLALKNRVKIYRTSLLFFSCLLLILFFFSTFYKDNFWSNYYEGIHYFFLIILTIIFSIEIKSLKSLFYYFKIGIVIILLFFSLEAFNKELNRQSNFEGIKVQTAAVNYVLANEKVGNKFCVKIYTPPVIPYTYDYLFLYNKLVGKTIYDPAPDWVDNKCWFIIEDDEYKFRKEDWMNSNIPKNSFVVNQTLIKDISIQLRSISR